MHDLTKTRLNREILFTIQSCYLLNRKEHPILGGIWMLLFKGNGRNVHVQTKGVYVWYVIYFTSLLYHEINDTSTFHIECNMIVTHSLHDNAFLTFLWNSSVSDKYFCPLEKPYSYLKKNRALSIYANFYDC